MTRFQQSLLILTIAVLPFAAEPFRLDPFEPHRAGLLGVLVMLSLIAAGPFRLWALSESRPLLLAIGFWIVALVLSTLFSLSTTRSFAGDLISRMGLLTQLALIAGVFLGRHVDPRRWWRWFWLAGVVGAIYVLLEASGLLWNVPLIGRPPGPLGVATFTAGWLVLLIVWCAVPLLHDPPSLRRALIDWAGVALMAIACLATGSRGALVALGAGGITVSLIGFMARPPSRLAVGLIRAGLLIALVLLIGVQTAPIPDLIERVGGSSLHFRETLWADARTLSMDWPELVTIQGEPDRWAGLRPLLGYGAEMFEPPHRLYFDQALNQLALNQRVDRAHNDLLDSLVTGGVLGLVARVGLWLTVIWTALRRLGYSWSPLYLMLPLGFAVLAFVAGANVAPVTAPLAGLIGVWLLLTVRRRASGPVDLNGWIALAVVTAHLIDIQFSFETVATAWPAWLAVGLLLAPLPRTTQTEMDRSDAEPSKIMLWAWAGIAGMVLLRFLLASGAAWIGVGLLLIALVLAVLSVQRPSTGVWLMPVLWAFGVLGAQLQTPEAAALWDVIALGLAIAVLTFVDGMPFSISRLQPSLRWLLVLPLMILWFRDIAADNHSRLGRSAFPPETRVVEMVTAASLRPWDDRLFALAGNAASEAATSSAGGIDPAQLGFAKTLLLRSASLHPFDAGVALQLAIVEANQALLDQDSSQATNGALDHAQAYFQVAAQLWPNEPAVWREWGRFMLDIQADAMQALPLLQHALALDPGDEAAQLLLARAMP